MDNTSTCSASVGLDLAPESTGCCFSHVFVPGS